MAAHTFYRIVRTDPPTIDGFTSNAASGRVPRRTTPELRRLWDGLSVFDSEERTREQAERFPGLGRFIATLEVPADAAIRYERTTTRPGHDTLWGEASLLLACVVRVVPI